MKEKCVVLLSGGIDSSVMLAMAVQSYDVFPLIFDYGQPNKRERSLAWQLCKHLQITSATKELTLGSYKTILGMRHAQVSRREPGEGMYYPARNTLFFAYGLAQAEMLNASLIAIGIIGDDPALEYNHPDGSDAYADVLANLSGEATPDDVNIDVWTPLMGMTKYAIIEQGRKLKVPFELTSSCIAPDIGHLDCGRCQKCYDRKAAFRFLGVKDPTYYSEQEAL